MLSSEHKAFFLRSASGLCFVTIVTASIFVHEYCFFALIFIFNLISLLEFSRMSRKMGVRLNLPLTLIIGSTLFLSGTVHIIHHQAWGFVAVLTLMMLLGILELFRNQGNGINNIAMALYSIIFVSLPFTLLLYIPYLSSGGWQPQIVFATFLLVWINDTFAYLTGVSFGRHKLFPRISPKKSWEGVVGGTLFTVLAAWLIAIYLPEFSIFEGVVVGFIVSIFGVFGDLLESMFKRQIVTKDSGHLMPGHGGLLDRFDSFLFVIPALFIFLLISRSL